MVVVTSSEERNFDFGDGYLLGGRCCIGVNAGRLFLLRTARFSTYVKFSNSLGLLHIRLEDCSFKERYVFSLDVFLLGKFHVLLADRISTEQARK